MNTLVKLLKDTRTGMAEYGITDTAAADALARQIESLPINTSQGIPQRLWMGFVLIANEWWPITILNECGRGWCEWAAYYPEGNGDQGLAQPGTWAHCTADYTPCLPD
jgi:hypothetical protein